MCVDYLLKTKKKYNYSKKSPIHQITNSFNFLVSCKYHPRPVEKLQNFLFKYAWFSRYRMLKFDSISSRVTRLNNFAALRTLFFKSAINALHYFLIVCNIFSKICRKINGQTLLHRTEATQNRDILYFGATFWLYFSRKQPHPKAFFHGSY